MPAGDGRQRGASAGAAVMPPMPREPHPALEPDTVGDEVLAELIRRVQEIESRYRDAAEKMGQLYMYADRHDRAALTRSLDKPMRNASANERTLAAILDELLASANRRRQRKPTR